MELNYVQNLNDKLNKLNIISKRSLECQNLSTVAMPEEDHATHKKNLSYIEALGKHTNKKLKTSTSETHENSWIQIFVPWFSHRTIICT